MGSYIPNWSKTRLIAGNLPIEKCLFNFTVKTLDGVTYPMEQLKGKFQAFLICNVASKCKLTPQHYKELVELQSVLQKSVPEKKLQIIGFPCGQFANQEFDTADEIKNFVKQYNVNFPLMEKVEVNGEHAHPLFKFLKLYAPEMHKVQGEDISLSAIEWNFGKFFLDEEGHVVTYVSPKETPLTCVPILEKILKGEMKGHTMY